MHVCVSFPTAHLWDCHFFLSNFHWLFVIYKNLLKSFSMASKTLYNNSKYNFWHIFTQRLTFSLSDFSFPQMHPIICCCYVFVQLKCPSQTHMETLTSYKASKSICCPLLPLTMCFSIIGAWMPHLYSTTVSFAFIPYLFWLIVGRNSILFYL